MTGSTIIFPEKEFDPFNKINDFENDEDGDIWDEETGLYSNREIIAADTIKRSDKKIGRIVDQVTNIRNAVVLEVMNRSVGAR